MGKGKKGGKSTATPTVRVSNEPEARVEGPVVELALDKLRVDDSKNLRKFPVPAQSIRELADSIRTQGLINPVIVYPVPENGDGATHQLEAGYQRVKALALLADEGYPVPVRATVISGPSEGINLDENAKRTNLSPMDKAYILKEKVEKGMGKGEAGKSLGLSPTSVTRLLALTGLRPTIQEKIHKGLITARAMAVLPELDEKGQDEFLADLDKATGGSASTKAGRVKKKLGRKGKQGRKRAKSSEPGTDELSAALESQVETIKATEGKIVAADKKALELYACLKGFLAGKMSMKALHKRVLVLVASR